MKSKLMFCIILAAFCGCANTPVRKDIDGIDVSRHQGSISWGIVKEQLVNNAFVYIKCTEGATYVDPNFKVNAKAAKASGLHVGCYHYFRMTSSAEAQFNNFKNAISEVEFDLIPMIDIETDDGYGRDALQKELLKFIRLIEKEYHIKPMIYGTNRSYNSYCAPEFNNYPLYIGRYGDNVPVVTGPSHYTIWQYSDKTKIHGINKVVDACRFHPQKDIKDILM